MCTLKQTPRTLKSFYPLESSAPTSSSIPSSSRHRSAKAFATILPARARIEELSAQDPEAQPSHFSISENGYLLFRGSIFRPRLQRSSPTHHPRIPRPSLSGHPGVTKTLQAIRCRYWWPQITVYVKDYIASCPECRRSKTIRHKPYGPLRFLPIPERPWNSLSNGLH